MPSVRRRRPKRRATAVVEMAICLPVLVTLTFATVDLCSVFFLRETVLIAAYEGSRVGINQGGTNDDASARVRQILEERNIDDANAVITFEGASFDDADTLEHITMVVTVPASGNLIAPTEFYNNLNITARITMRKEFANQE